METIATDTISGLRIYWRKLGMIKDQGNAREGLLTVMGYPSRVTLKKYLDHPGQMKVSLFQQVFQYLRTHYPELTPEDLLYMH